MKKTYQTPQAEEHSMQTERLVCESAIEQLGKKRGSEPEEESASGSGIW